MDLVFNELSINPTANTEREGYDRVICFLQTFKRASDFGFNKIRFDVPAHQDILCQTQITDTLTLADFRNKFTNNSSLRRFGDLLIGLPKRPFIDDNSVEENRYIENNFILRKNNQEVNPFGLAAAYLYSIPGIGFCSELFWEDCIFEIIITGPEQRTENVFCVSKPVHFDNPELTSFIENNAPIELVESHIDPKAKGISLSRHHGYDILLDFARTLVRSPYVIEVINSLPYNPYASELIKQAYPNGNIELVLTNTVEGFGLIIKTTGRNIRETKEIAERLKREYS